MYSVKTLSPVLVAAGLSLSSSAVLAENKYYIGGNLGAAVIECNSTGAIVCSNEDSTLPSLYGRLGIQPYESLSVEIRGGTSVGDGDIDVSVGGSTVEIDFSLEYFFGGYLRVGRGIGEYLYPYLIAGYTTGKVKGSAAGVSETASESSLSYGIGTDIKITETLSGNIEIIRYYSDLSAGAIGLVWSF